MAEVLELSPAASAVPAPRHQRIRWTSRTLAWLFTLLFGAYGLGAGAVILAFLVPYAGEHVSIGPVGMLLDIHAETSLPPGYVAVGSLPLIQRLAHVLAGLVVVAPPLVIFWNLRQLFGLYGQGVVFARDNARHIRWVGAALAADAAAPFLVHTGLTAAGLAIDHRWMHLYSLQELVLGGIVYVIALVMEAGQEIEEERRQFV